MKINLNSASKRLFLPWLYCTFFLILIILLQTTFRRYGNGANAAWWWAMFKVLPCTLLILWGYLNYSNLYAELKSTHIVLFKLSFYLSLAYLLTTIVALLIQPWITVGTAIEKLHSTDAGLFFFQALVFTVICVFIVKTQKLSLSVTNPPFADEFYDGQTRVFISYNHADREAADELKSMLEKKNIKVIIDSSSMRVGEDIKEFIQRSVMRSQITLAIVSRKSLLSSWVSLETIDTFYLEKFTKRKRFIAAYLDEDIFNLSFTAEAIEHINWELEKIREQIKKRDKLGIDSRDLNIEKSRIMSLRSHLDEIIQKLHGSRCIDIRKEKLPETFPVLLASIESNEHID
jgi:hypothetical protein